MMFTAYLIVILFVRSVILHVVCVKIKLAVYKLRSLNARVLRATILPGLRLWPDRLQDTING